MACDGSLLHEGAVELDSKWRILGVPVSDKVEWEGEEVIRGRQNLGGKRIFFQAEWAHRASGL